MFIPLRVHSVYSKGNGGITLQEMALWVRKRKFPYAALTDIENVYGWGRWKRAALESGFTPLFGCEIGLQKRRFLFLAKTMEGYWNLMEILNSKEIKQTKGLIIILIPRPGHEAPLENLEFTEGEDFYLGCDFFNIKKTRELSENRNFPLVWANALKFVREPERLILLHAIHKKIPFPPEKNRLEGRMKFFGPDQGILALKKFGSEVREIFKNTFEIAEKCEFSFENIVPVLPEDLFSAPLRDVVMRKLRSLKNLGWQERQRAGMELAVVEQSGVAPYFLIVHDVVQFACRNGILYNLKGSGASSFLAYLLGISRINPIEFDLYFERFLNNGRSDPPDFDLDFDSRKRDKVISYVLGRYGKGKTGAACVCSLKNYRARSALYETARAFGLSPEESRSLSKKAPFFAEPDFLKKDKPCPGYMEIWKAAAGLSSVYSEISLHVGGILLTPAPVSKYLPLAKSAKGYVMAHFDRDAVEDLKLIKLDLLSVRGLAAISETRKRFNVKNVPPKDARALNLLKRAQTIGCFQVESPAMMNLLRRMKPENIHDLTQALALIRPGPTESGMKQTLLRKRQGKSVCRDLFMEKILPETEGLLLYEEQVMQIAERVAGMPPEEGDLLRCSLKKNRENSTLKRNFLNGANGRGYSAGEAKKLWETMKKFSSYSFNKAHSVSYAYMAYQAVYLKVHYPVAYMTAVLNAGGGYYSMAEYIEEAKRMGIKILAPDVNRSIYRFEVEGSNIRVGLTSIKGLSLKTLERIVKERENGKYSSIEDVLSRVHLTKTELFSLIRAGVFDSLEPQRIYQVLRYFRGLKGMENMSDLDSKQKEKMLIESLGFDPEGDSLSLVAVRRPPLRIKDLVKYTGQEVELMVRVVDARRKMINGSQKYFFLFEDETGLLEGVGERKCLIFGSPSACCLRGVIKKDSSGSPKIFDCTFYME